MQYIIWYSILELWHHCLLPEGTGVEPYSKMVQRLEFHHEHMLDSEIWSLQLIVFLDCKKVLFWIKVRVTAATEGFSVTALTNTIISCWRLSYFLIEVDIEQDVTKSCSMVTSYYMVLHQNGSKTLHHVMYCTVCQYKCNTLMYDLWIICRSSICSHLCTPFLVRCVMGTLKSILCWKTGS